MTDHIIKAAQECGFEVHPGKQQARVGWDALIGEDSTPKLARFWAIAYRAGMERAAEIPMQIDMGIHGVMPIRAALIAKHIQDTIRAEAHAQNQPKNEHDGSVV